MIRIKLCLLFHRRKKKTAIPTSIRNTMPPITPPAIAAPVFDFGSKTANLKKYRNYHPLKKFNTSDYFYCLIKLTTKMFLQNYFPLLCILAVAE